LAIKTPAENWLTLRHPPSSYRERIFIIMTQQETLALFGATGRTGKHVLQGALEKNYKVRHAVGT
jgi:hypothetical protein